MKTKRYSTEQMIGILQEAETGLPLKELCRKHGVIDATTYNWKSKFGDMTSVMRTDSRSSKLGTSG